MWVGGQNTPASFIPHAMCEGMAAAAYDDHVDMVAYHEEEGKGKVDVLVQGDAGKCVINSDIKGASDPECGGEFGAAEEGEKPRQHD